MQNYYSYYVTQDGRVFNKFGDLLTTHDNGRGYQILNLRWDGEAHCKAIQRLVAEVYLPNPMKLSDVNHKDCDRTNNDVSNLEWMSHGDNIKYSYDMKRRSAKGSNNSRALLTEDDVRDICTLLQQGYKSCNIRDMGYPYIPVGGIKSRKNWTYISKDYSF